MKKIKKKLSLKKVSIAQVGNTNKIKGGSLPSPSISPNQTLASCNAQTYYLCSFEVDTDVSIGCPQETTPFTSPDNDHDGI